MSSIKALSMQSLLKSDTGIVAVIGASFGGVIDVVYGSNNLLLVIALCGAIFLDWLAGIRASRIDGTYSSEYGIAGVIRTVVLLSLPAYVNLLDHAFNLPGVLFYGVTIGLLYHTLKSFVANAIRANWGTWMPVSLLNFLLDWVGSELQAKMNRSFQRQQPEDQGEPKV